MHYYKTLWVLDFGTRKDMLKDIIQIGRNKKQSIVTERNDKIIPKKRVIKINLFFLQ